MVSTNMNVNLLAGVGLIWHLLPFHQNRSQPAFWFNKKKRWKFCTIAERSGPTCFGWYVYMTRHPNSSPYIEMFKKFSLKSHRQTNFTDQQIINILVQSLRVQPKRSMPMEDLVWLKLIALMFLISKGRDYVHGWQLFVVQIDKVIKRLWFD